MDFRILGPLEALDRGEPVVLGGSRQRALLALLLLHANEVLGSDRLIDGLWGESPPAAAAKTLQVRISRLRKALAHGASNGASELVVTREHGYELRLDLEHLDAHRFERLLAEGRDELAAGRAERAAPALEQALSLWRGRPLDDLAYEPFVQREVARLDDLRGSAFEQLVEARLALGRHAEVVGELEPLIEDYPYRERLRAQLMLALYRCDRQADALQAYQDARRKLVEELGIEPGERLRELERAILAQEPALALPAREAVEPPTGAEPELGRAPPEAGGARSARRLATVVFADLESTGLAELLDPESMHGLLDRFSDVCSAVIERHGGTVAAYVGNAVVGVFGQAEVHEDDSLRAIRAAVELREAGAALSAEIERDRGVHAGMKLGLESGEVFVSAGSRRSSFAAGDAFDVAARLEGVAEEGEILLGDEIHRLVRGAVRAEPLEPLDVRGRAAKLQAWRLLNVDADGSAIARSFASPFVGRRRELDALRTAFARAREERGCHAVTVIGPAGMGKSRLARELIAEAEDDATVVVGRCPSYGEGMTYRPLAEIVGQLGAGDTARRVAELLDGDERMAQPVLAAIGLRDGAAQPEETFWAVRRMLERVARERPLVVVVDDVHWADPTLLDLLDHLVAFSSGEAMLLVCLARPELLDARPAWSAPQPGKSLLVLEALSDADSRELVENAGAGELRSGTAARIVETAEGNPLFLEHLAAVGAETGEASLPSSIQAVLAARIDRLAPGERALLEHASVQGRSFYVGAVEELLPDADRAATATHLVSLVHKQLIRAERSDLAGEDAFRFAHVLIREAAYRGLPKGRCAEVHERVAGWLDQRPGAHDEIVGHHLAEAYRQRADLGRIGERERALGAAAAERLSAAADAALLRGDARAGARLLERSESLVEPDGPAHAALLPRLGAALLEAGRLADAARVLTEAIDHAHGDPWLRARAQVERQLVRLQAGSSASAEQTERIADSALTVLEAHGDELGQCRALCLRARHDFIEGRCARADEAWRRAAEHAWRAGDEGALFEILDWRAAAALVGPMPVEAAIALCRQIHEQVRGSAVAVARTSRPMAALHAMAGNLDEADRLVRASDELLGELGGLDSAVTQQEALVEMLAGRPAAAEERLRRGYEQLEAMGEKALLATTAAMLAQALHDQARHREAAAFCRASEQAAAEDDLAAQVGWRAVRARLLADEGNGGEAEELAAEAVRLAEPTDFLALHAEALMGLGAVLRHGRRWDEADAAIRAALELYRRKGDAVSAERAGALLGTAAGGRGASERMETRHVQVRDGDHR